MYAREMAKMYMRKNMKRDWRGCWLWQGSLMSNGYGYLKLKGWPHNTSVHRLAMHLWKGFDLESSLYVCHTCDTRHCFNPQHLWLGTQSENIIDGFRKGRMDRGEKHYNSKLTEKDVRAILRAVDKGEVQAHLARKFNIAGSVITKIKQGRLWRPIYEEHYGKVK